MTASHAEAVGVRARLTPAAPAPEASAPPEPSATSGGLGLPDRVARGEPDREAVDAEEGREPEAAPWPPPQVPEREERAGAPQEEPEPLGPARDADHVRGRRALRLRGWRGAVPATMSTAVGVVVVAAG